VIDRGALNYASAKACGMFGKAFLGRRLARLQTITRLSELDRQIFPERPLNLSESELAGVLERRIAERSVSNLLRLLKAFPIESNSLIFMLRAIEFADLKIALGALQAKEVYPPSFMNIAPWGRLHFAQWPNLEKILEGSDLEWVNKDRSEFSAAETGTHIDQFYYQSLWNLLLQERSTEALLRLYADEISLQNCIWALRLSRYYQMPEEEISKRLVHISYEGRSLSEAAMNSLGFHAELREDWDAWKYREFINPAHTSETQWRIDPRYFQNAAARSLYRRSRRLFRFGETEKLRLAAFIKLQQYEQDILTSLAEGVQLGMSVKDIISGLEVLA
jgi:hypothetical protein